MIAKDNTARLRSASVRSASTAERAVGRLRMALGEAPDRAYVERVASNIVYPVVTRC